MDMTGDDIASSHKHRFEHALDHSMIIAPEDRVLITGAAGFIGSPRRGDPCKSGIPQSPMLYQTIKQFRRNRCDHQTLASGTHVEVFQGNLSLAQIAKPHVRM